MYSECSGVNQFTNQKLKDEEGDQLKNSADTLWGIQKDLKELIGANGRAEVLSRELKDSKSQKQCYLGWGKVKLPIGPQLPKAMTDLKGMGKES
ncbi:hypothetical protein Celaphus_00010987 [Cervus elaphus hippelaphus]|uniref:Uncharacterized protein n=1 Tax=Cervus elaphus hippelaphus TaxID=46360 RepID=A0A212CRB7_CEREH|nr:hypothetical protein Celaphus_00010987 [Cervus elaphus hippelaphus]